MGRVPSDASVTGMQPLWVLWLFGYAYAFVIALVLQKLVMPIMPDLHAGHGLMSHDAITFHDMAVAMAERIHALGWSEWRLVPGSGTTANVGILAAIYAVLGADPVWFIPLNAGFHSLGALLVLRLGLYLLPGRGGWVAGGAAAVLFLAFPSALVWYGQNHKDTFLIAGYLLVLFAFVRALARTSLLEMSGDVVLMGAGCVLVAIMRPHMLMVYTVAFAVAIVATAFWKLIRPQSISSSVVRNGALMFVMMVVATMTAPKGSELTEIHPAYTRESKAIAWRWERTGFLPDTIELKLEQASFVRAHFLISGKLVSAGSTVDGDISPANVWEMAAYLPRALWVGLFAPFPDTWLERPTVPRLIGAVETLIFYLMVPGIIILAWRKPSLPLFVCLAVSAIVLTVLSYTSPNVGTLHRIRYGPLFVFMLAGACGWIWLLGKAGHLLGTTRDIPHGGKVGIPSVGKAPGAAVLGDKISGNRAVGAGVLVTLISMVGALGLLIRDLLLINRSDFGTPLDSFYLAMMVPMLFVSILSLPLADALTAALPRMKERNSVQSLLGTASAISLLALGLLCLVLFFAGGPIYRNFVAGGDIAQILTLLPLALLLLFFSGLVVTGNSLLNSLDKPALAASAQLIVPLAAVAAIFFAPEDRLIIMATAGMVAGQMLNLVILFVLARRRGYHLFPSSIKRMSGEGRMLANYGWLVAAALLASLSIPFNYWLAGQLGAGAVSTWAVGSKLVQMATALGVAMMSAVWVPYFSKLVTAGLHLRIRGEVYLSLLAGSWGGGLVALVVFGFAGPMVMAVMPAVQDEMRVAQLTGVIQIGALQLPLLASGLMLLKLSAVSAVSWKVVAATLVGLVANVALGYTWLSVWGIFGIAAAWCIATLLTTTVIMFATRAQSFLGWGELIGIVASWLVIGAFAVAIHVKSLSVTAGVILICVLVLVAQVKTLISGRTAPELVTG
jgi:putative peptidoglycan lipid II flippase